MNNNQELLDLMRQGAHPTTWDGFVGQTRATKQLQIKARSAAVRNTTIGHVVLYSPEPGVGKTSLAMLMAKEAGRQIKVISGQLDLNEFRYHLTYLNDGDIIVWDEFQQQFPTGTASRKKWEWLLHYLQQGVLISAQGVHRVPKVTIVGATTDFGLLPETIRQRIETPIELQPYTWEEQVMIVAKMTQDFIDNIADYVTIENIASAAAGKPREMRRILAHLRDLVITETVTPFDNGDGTYFYDIGPALEWLGLSSDGLTPLGQKFLLFLFDECHGEPVGLARIIEHLGEDRRAIQETEQLLVGKRLLLQSARGQKPGRVLTDDGMQRAKELLADLQMMEVQA